MQDRGLIYSLLALTALVLAVSLAIRHFDAPVDQAGREVLFLVEPGQTLPVVARRLREEGLIRHELFARLWVRQSRDLSGRMRVGEFSLSTGWSTRRILEALERGPLVLHRIQIPEGLTLWQTAQAVAQTGLASAESFTKAARDPDILARHRIPAASAEGYLFPETYMVTRPVGGDARIIVERMLAEFERRTKPLWQADPPSPAALHQLVIKASIVEKETSVPEERERVAGVYENRLKKGMLLQSDPTVIYGIGQGFDGDIRRRDLDNEANRYNTYRHPGLPPGPICSPGLDSLRAALKPESHGYLFFVATGDGGHEFNIDLDGHNRAVARLRRR